MPRLGFASCGIDGWGRRAPDEAILPRPEGVDDPDALYVTAIGQSMIPEGIRPGAFCLVSPAKDVEPGDRVWIKDTRGYVAIKRVVEIAERGFKLRGWQPITDGKQSSYEEDRFTNGIDSIYPVIAVNDRLPGSPEAALVPDPRRAGLPDHSGGDAPAPALMELGFGLVQRHEAQSRLDPR